VILYFDTWQGAEKRISGFRVEPTAEAPCMKDGFLPQSSPPDQGEIREGGRAAETFFTACQALVKLYFAEQGSGIVQRALGVSIQNATSMVTYVETLSALSRKLRMRELDDEAFRRHKSEFERDWEYLAKVAFDTVVCGRAAELVQHFPLKAYDAIQLASAELVRRTAVSSVTFACFDAGLCRAAAALGFALSPES
jgi:predicted nucleic acid-binding protein